MEKGKIVLNTNRSGYETHQISETLTVRSLIDLLTDFPDDTPVYFGNDRQSYGWYTYGEINEWDLHYIEADEDEEESEE